MEDNALILAAAATKTSTYTSTPIDVTQGVGGWSPDSAPSDPGAAGGGGAGLPVVIVVPVTACDATDGDETYSLVVKTSATSGGTYAQVSGTLTIPRGVTGTYQIGAFLPQGQPWVEVVLTLGGTTPSITFNDVYIEPLVAHGA